MITIKDTSGKVLDYKRFNFPCGEISVDLNVCFNESRVIIEFEFENNSEIMELLLIANGLKNLGVEIDILSIPYVPYSRQDRICNFGEALSLKVFADVINSIQARAVTIMDPHSDVTPALINNCSVVEQHHIFADYFYNEKDFALVSPDAGAMKKIHKLAGKLRERTIHPVAILECSKQRHLKTGEIIGVDVHGFCAAPSGNDIEKFFIVDDLCDGGKTFIEIAKKIKAVYSGKIILMITHGFFTKGLSVFDGLIDEIYTRKGRVK